MNMDINRFFKGLTIVAFFLLIGGMVAAWKTPVTGYEISIFSVTPFFYWFGFGFGIVTVFLILITELLGKSVPQYLRITKWVLLAVCMISFTMLLTIRGFYGMNFNGDTGTHIGALTKLLREGTITVIYPNLYFLTANLNLLLSVDIISLTKIIPALFVLVFIMGVYLAVKEIFQSKRIATLSATLACALPFGTANNYTGSLPLPDYIPYLQGLLAFSPFLIYVVFAIVNNRHPKHAFVLLGCFLLISVLFYHILAAAVLLLFVLCVCTGLLIQKNRRGKDVGTNIRCLLIIAGTTIIGWILWTIYLGYLRIPVLSIYNILLGNVGSAYSEELNTELSNAASYNIFTLFDYAVKQFGTTCLVFLILFIAFIITFIYYRKNGRYLNAFPFYLVLIPLLGVAGFSLIAHMSFQPGRIVMFITILGVLFSGFVLTHLFDCAMGKSFKERKISEKKRGVRLFSGALFIVIILSLFILGLQMYYPGAEVYSTLNDNTKSDVSGMQFYFEKGSSQYAYNAFTGYAPSRWAELIYSKDYTQVQNPVSPLFGSAMSFTYKDAGLNKPYINYADFTSINEALDVPGYLLIGKRALVAENMRSTQHLKQSTAYWLDKDTAHLNYDASVHSVYNNGEFNLYIIE